MFLSRSPYSEYNELQLLPMREEARQNWVKAERPEEHVLLDTNRLKKDGNIKFRKRHNLTELLQRGRFGDHIKKIWLTKLIN